MFRNFFSWEHSFFWYNELTMHRSDLIAIQTWFDAYTQSFFRNEVSHLDANDLDDVLSWKRQHSFGVWSAMLFITREESMSKQDKCIAEATALLHDVGRFPQYVRHRTFLDSMSVNHGELGAEVLLREGALSFLPDRERELVIFAVKHHNAYHVPDMSDRRKEHLLRLIRDADKIDIWRVMLRYYATPEEQRSPGVGMGLPDTQDYTPELLASIHEGKMIRYEGLQTLNDYRLMQLSWTYDLATRGSLRLVQRRRLVERTAAYLPHDRPIREALDVVRDYVLSRFSREACRGR
jgi:hypothetical protein